MENKNMDVKAEEMEVLEEAAEETAEEIPAITKKDVNKLFFRWYVRAEMSNSFERLQSLSFCSAMSPALRKLYPDKEKRAEALQRNLQFLIRKVFSELLSTELLSLWRSRRQEVKTYLMK